MEFLIRICDAVPDSVLVREYVNTTDLAQSLVVPPSEAKRVSRSKRTSYIRVHMHRETCTLRLVLTPIIDLHSASYQLHQPRFTATKTNASLMHKAFRVLLDWLWGAALFLRLRIQNIHSPHSPMPLLSSQTHAHVHSHHDLISSHSPDPHQTRSSLLKYYNNITALK